MGRTVEEPSVKSKSGISADREHEVTHPAYAQVTVHQIQGTGQVLYGSDHQHMAGVRLVVSESSMRRANSRDWPHAGDQILVVEMSHVQWASLVSGMNSSEGTQATLRRVRAGPLVQVPGLPLRDSGAPEHTKDAEETLRAATTALAELRDNVLNVKGLTRRDRDMLLSGVDAAHRKLTDSLPHILHSFIEHMEDRVAKARIDIQAWWQTYRGRQGIGRDAPPPLSDLSDGEPPPNGPIPDQGAGRRVENPLPHEDR